MESNSHTFVICAYKESEYLEECICSLKRQSVKSEILMVTSTPNEWIKRNSEKYNIPLVVNLGESGIAQDWNFAYEQCNTDYITIAHQDDLYFQNYTEEILKRAISDALILFSDYAEIREHRAVSNNVNLRIKKMLLFPLRFALLQGSMWVRRRVLSLGNPICCPGVTYVRKNIEGKLFHPHFRSNVDWDTWEKLSRRKGKFVYIPQILMGHRIHEGSETSATIHENLRTQEDLEMFKRFWPQCIANKLTDIYANSEKSNNIQKGEKN